MTHHNNSINALVSIIENPFVEKGYKELKKYYMSVGRDDYVNALQHLIEKKFSYEPKNTPDSKQQ